MVCEDTLQVKNFPPELSDSEKEEFLLHFGATSVKVITSKVKQSSVSYAKFKSKEVARNVMSSLHQIKVLNYYLTVKYAEHSITEVSETRPKLNVDKNENKKHLKSFVNKLHAFNSAVGFNQPPPCHLKYSYPKPNRATINNIAHALASVPKFYTQVLHLMNRMNFPPPFSDIPDAPVIRHNLPQQQIVPKVDSEESEIESDPETNKPREIIPVKRQMPQKQVIKRPKLIKPPTIVPQAIASVSKPLEASDVFEKVELQPRKIELKLTSDNLEQVINSAKEASAIQDIEQLNLVETITLEELNSGKITPEELAALPVFKNYHPGPPTAKLYIKNIAKTVDVSKLEKIYKRYNQSLGETSQFAIKLMQEGRMKGQAFVTLDSVVLAQQAVQETNGYVLEDKPLVVAFAKSLPSK